MDGTSLAVGTVPGEGSACGGGRDWGGGFGRSSVFAEVNGGGYL